ncbi:MAG: glycosyltransferase family 2 protein [Candidatus Binatia bacterium]
MRRPARETVPWLLGLFMGGLMVAGVAVYVRLLHEHDPLTSTLVRLAYPVMVGFLGVLLVRYFALLWFAFLGHVEDTASSDDGFEPLVSIIVPAFNERRVIDQTLASLLALDYSRFEIVVVDDGSNDGTFAAAVARARQAGRVPVHVVSQPNGGKASALDRGIAAAAGEYVLCVDGDSVLHPGSLTAAVRHFRDPRVGAVAGNVKVANRVNLLTWMQAIEYAEGLNVVRRAQAFFHAVNIVPGPLGMFRRQAIASAGGYARDTFAEDFDLTIALLERGWCIAYEPRAISYTEAPARLLPLLKQRYRWTRGMLQALRKRRRLLFRPGGLGVGLTLWLLVFDCLLWPVMNLFATILFLAVVARYGFTSLMVLWWLQLTMLDVAGAFFAVAIEGEDPRMVLMAPIYRACYILLIDAWKVPASVEELLGVTMTWNKLERVGLERRR